jgi:hypothetical protein
VSEKHQESVVIEDRTAPKADEDQSGIPGEDDIQMIDVEDKANDSSDQMNDDDEESP